MAALTRVRSGYFLSNLASVLNVKLYNVNKFQQALFHCSSFLNVKGMEIKMPSLSPTMMEGKIVKWLKKEGDSVNPGDVLCDIETDKAIVSMEIEEEGVLAKILIPENTSSIKVGSLIALMVSEGEDWKRVEIPQGTDAETASSPSAQPSTPKPTTSPPESEVEETSGGGGGPPSISITMPSLSPTMTSGTIVKWLKKEGDKISPGDVLCDIQTDKAIMSMEIEEEGILAKILVPDDSKDVEVGTLIALIVAEGEDWQKVTVPSSKKPAAAAAPAPATAPTPTPAADSSSIPSPTPTSTGGDFRVKTYGPAVKLLLSSYQLEPGLIKPTGRSNRLLKEDVLKYIEDNKLEKKPLKVVSPPTAHAKASKPTKTEMGPRQAKPSVPSPKYVDIETTSMRKVIAKRLVESKTLIPHCYSMSKCDVSKILEARNAFKEEGLKVSVNDFITKATALALQIYPKANSLFVNNQVKTPQDVDVCVAVATDSGLFTPIIKSANRKSVVDISNEIKNLAVKAKAGKLKPEEYMGGSFTISNLGMFGITHFKAIINPPQCGILAVGGTIETLDVDLNVQKHTIFSLSFDRRVLDDQEAAEFMETLKHIIENPNLILFGVERPPSVVGL